MAHYDKDQSGSINYRAFLSFVEAQKPKTETA